MPKHPLPYLKYHVAVTGDHRCGLFMKDLFDWLVSSEGGIKFDDREWIAFTRGQWAEKFQFTPDQLRLVLEKLSSKKFIIRKQRVYRRYVPLHVSITDEYFDELMKCLDLEPTEYKKAKSAPTVAGQKAQPGQAESPASDGGEAPTLI